MLCSLLSTKRTDQTRGTNDQGHHIDQHLRSIVYSQAPDQECYGAREKGNDVPGIGRRTHGVEAVTCYDEHRTYPLDAFIDMDLQTRSKRLAGTL